MHEGVFCNWMPEESFLDQNRHTLDRIRSRLIADFPEEDAAVLDFSSDIIPQSSMKWMWKKLLGKQHGAQLGLEGKIPFSSVHEDPYRELVEDLRYGPFSFGNSYRSGSQEYDKGIVLGGTPAENATRFIAIHGGSIALSGVRETIFLGGQRLRWNIAGERTAVEVIETAERYVGLSADMLRERSPWLRTELQKDEAAKSRWQKPLATEFDIERLVTELAIQDYFSWGDYPVEVLQADDDTTLAGVPPREAAGVRYHLPENRSILVVNAPAIPRNGEPRPTSDSTMTEALNHLTFGENEAVIFGINVPHIRSALDAALRLTTTKPNRLSVVDVAAADWLDEVTSSLAGLGEIPATYKIDARLRAFVQGQDPNAAELLTL